jgi:transcriptional regulator with PAS, ATPase and Fis domain
VIDDQVKTAEIAQKILAGVRTMDLLATYGRRDLELMLPETNKEDARQLMQYLLRQLIKQLNSNMPLRIGLASFPVEATTRHQLIETARQPIWMEQSNPQLGEISDRGNASLNSSLTGLSQQGTTPSASLIDEKIILHSPKMRELYQTAMRIASTPISVMIQGETGTGKELVAESIHLHSDRANKQFLAINCGAFTVNLLESELFGHERGSFTGADQRKIGLLEAVKGGTLFMDEIGEIPPPLQVKLLRVLQDNMIRRVGGTEMIQVNFRVVSATNRNIRKMVEQGTFREDLYYRLNAIILEVPPLRERLEEIPHIAKFFLDQYKAAYHKNDLKFSKAAQEALQQYHWPGNVRELKNCMERAVVTTEGNIVFPENLNLPTARQATPRPHFKQSSSHTSKGNIGDTIAGAMRPQLDDYEKQLIVSALQKTNWNQTKASTLLKIPRRTLVSKIKKFGIVKP